MASKTKKDAIMFFNDYLRHEVFDSVVCITPAKDDVGHRGSNRKRS